MKKLVVLMVMLFTLITSVIVLDYILAAISSPDSFLLFLGVVGFMVLAVAFYAIFRFLVRQMIKLFKKEENENV